jgi:putative tryptophan/tyrosine transport system substrate-binding protein
MPYSEPWGRAVRRRDFINAVARVAAVWPLAARAQQQLKLPVVGYLSTGSPEADATPFLAAFRKGLGEMSFVEGKNVAIEYRWANFRYERLSAMAADLAQRSVAVIAAIGGTPTGLAAKAATSTVPIVFYLGIDPVKFGLVASLNHPGGNVTGIAALQAELVVKRIQFLHELVPKATVAALLANPDNPYTEPEVRAVQDAAHSLGLGELQILPASSASEIDAVFQRLPQLHVDALIVSADLFLLSQQKRIVAAATQYNLPTMYPWREYVIAGGMVSYGPSLFEAYRLVGVYTGKILRGAPPAELPVEQESKVDLVINLKATKAFQVSVPIPVVGRADEVIE